MALTRTDDELVLLHNPNCSKSRAVHAILTESGQEFRERRYLDDPLDREELSDLRERLGRPVGEWVRSSDATYAEAGLGAGSGEEELIAALEKSPKLMERPIVVRGPRAVVGRPPEGVRELL